MPVTYDGAADAVYVYLTGQPLTQGRTTLQVGTPPNVDGSPWTGRTTGSSALRSSTPAAGSTPTSSTEPNR